MQPTDIHFSQLMFEGAGTPEGAFHPFKQEARDGYDVVEWLARQSWCDGQVAMWGGSYAGYAQWVTAKEFPPHLKTIVPVAAPYMGVDSPMRGNIFAPYLMQWLTLVGGRTSQERLFSNSESFWGAQFRSWFESGIPFNQLDTFLGNPSPIFQDWISRPRPDLDWDTYNPTPQQSMRSCPSILSITGSYDADQCESTLMHYRKHLEFADPTNRLGHYLIVGPWDHAGTRTPRPEFGGLRAGAASLVDLRRLHLEWYDWVMKASPLPEFLKGRVAYYVMGAEKWRYAESLEAITATGHPLYLQSITNPTDVFHSGSLGEACQRQGPVQIRICMTPGISVTPHLKAQWIRTIVLINEW